MKTLLISILTFLHISFSYSQGHKVDCKKMGGVFKKYDSYLQNRYSDSVCLDNKRNSIYQGWSDKLIIKSEGKKSTFKPGEIYAYFDGEHTYRYFDTTVGINPKGYFNIEDTSGLVIYSQKHYYFRQISTNYYYSKGLDDPIKLLDIENLRSDFNNTDFINWVNQLKSLNFKNGSVFLVNELYKRYIR